jgi:UDP-4-amino-4,6-dideoxy-N-acetyl-beta-L-altrosamine transaminase
MTRLPYGRQWLDESDLQAVHTTLQSDWLTQGPEVQAFEVEFAAAVGAGHAVAVANGTVALHLACLAADLGAGHTLITSPITFLASANCGIYCGADVTFSDVGTDLPLLDPAELSKTIDRLQQQGAQPKVVVLVHYAGLCCDLEAIGAVAQRAGLTVIEDAAHALGARWSDAAGSWRSIGSCSHSAMTTFSFHPVKHITTGEGGMITTNSAELAARLRRLRSHGMEKNARTQEQGGWYYEMHEVGFNYRLTDFQATLGRTQLRKLGPWVQRRRAIMARYEEALAGHEWCRLLTDPAGQEASYHLAVLSLASGSWTSEQVAQRRRQFYDFMHAHEVAVQVHYIPVYRQPFYRERYGLTPSQFPNSERFYAGCLSLPLFPRMTDEEVERVIGLIRQAKPLLLG